MGCMVTKFDRTRAIQELEAHGVDTDEAIGIVHVIERRVLPHCASKHGESSARGRLTTRINQAFTDLSEVREDMADTRQRLTRVEETMATKQDLAEMRCNLIITFGGMLAAAVGFLTVVQGFLN